MTIPPTRRQAVIDDGLEYMSGILEQKCAVCDRKATHCTYREFSSCPQCGEPLEPPGAISFGGLRVSYRDRKNGFIFAAPYCGKGDVRVYQGDAQEVLMFMARRFKPSGRRSLPTLAEIERLLLVVRSAIDGGEFDLARGAVDALLDELNPRRGSCRAVGTQGCN